VGVEARSEQGLWDDGRRIRVGVLAADYCDCESTKTVDIKRRVVEMKKQRSRNSQKSVWYVNIRADRSKRVGDCRSPKLSFAPNKQRNKRAGCSWKGSTVALVAREICICLRTECFMITV